MRRASSTGRGSMMEKPFGNDLDSAVKLNAMSTRPSTRSQIFRIDHFLGKEPAQNILAFRFANGLFEPIWNRNFIDHVQIDIPETLGLEQPSRVLRVDRAPTGTWSSRISSRCLRSSRSSRRRRSSRARSARRRTRCSARMMPIDPRNVVRGQYDGYRDEAGVAHAIRHRDVHRAQVRDRQLALGGRAVLPAHRQAHGRGTADRVDRLPRGAEEHVPRRTRVSARKGPDHLTFDLADASRLSLSFYGKRPGPGMRLDKLSMQFATSDTGRSTDVLEAYERLILDALRGDHTLFTTAEGIESLWERSIPLLDDPPPVSRIRRDRGVPTRSTN